MIEIRRYSTGRIHHWTMSADDGLASLFLGKCLPKMMLDYSASIRCRMTRVVSTCQVHDAVRDLLAERLAGRPAPRCGTGCARRWLELAGHIDVIWDGGLADIKTANPYLSTTDSQPGEGLLVEPTRAYARWLIEQKPASCWWIARVPRCRPYRSL